MTEQKNVLDFLLIRRKLYTPLHNNQMSNMEKQLSWKYAHFNNVQLVVMP